MESEPPFGEDRERDRRRLEGVLPELLKRALELGIGKLNEGREDVRAFVHDLKLPKELTTAMIQQLEATKDVLAQAVAAEVRSFLERTSLPDEARKILTGLTLEVKTQVRFISDDASSAQPPSDAEASASRPRTGDD